MRRARPAINKRDRAEQVFWPADGSGDRSRSQLRLPFELPFMSNLENGNAFRVDPVASKMGVHIPVVTSTPHRFGFGSSPPKPAQGSVLPAETPFLFQHTCAHCEKFFVTFGDATDVVTKPAACPFCKRDFAEWNCANDAVLLRTSTLTKKACLCAGCKSVFWPWTAPAACCWRCTEPVCPSCAQQTKWLGEHPTTCPTCLHRWGPQGGTALATSIQLVNQLVAKKARGSHD